MLIEKTPSPNDIVCIKTSSGDELIAKILEISESVVTVSKPMLMMLAQDPRTGQPGVQMVPFWMVGGDKDSRYPISRAHVVCMIKANKDATSSYTQQTTGLSIPGGSGLVV